MGLWKRLTDEIKQGPDRSAGGPEATAGRAGTGPARSVAGDDWMAVVGESFYRDELARVTGGGTGDHAFQAELVRDPTNPYDANCIKVVIEGQQVGNLSRENAERFADGFDAVGGRAVCPARVRRTDDAHDWNVVLQVNYDALEDLADAS